MPLEGIVIASTTLAAFSRTRKSWHGVTVRVVLRQRTDRRAYLWVRQVVRGDWLPTSIRGDYGNIAVAMSIKRLS